MHWGNGTFGESVLSNKTDIEKRNELGVSIYPNPSKSGLIDIRFQNTQQNTLIEVLNVNGQIISSQRLLWKQHHLIELNDSGIYFIRLISDEASMVQKIIII